MKDLFKKEIIVGVIVSILLTIFFQPIIQFVWSLLISSGVKVFSSLYDSAYKQAALGNNNHIEVLILTFGGAIFINGMFITVHKMHRSANLDLTNFKGTTSKEKNSTKVKKPTPTIEVRQKNLRLKIIRLYFLAILGGLSIMLIVSTEIIVLQTNSSFDQRLTVLAPTISEQEYKELKASWSSMQSRQDYENINNRIDNFASQNRVALPKLLWP